MTLKNKVADFEQWLYYLTGNTGANFSNTIASQILVVRLSSLAAKAVPHKNDNDPEWKWRVLNYYTTFDGVMNKSKMIENGYRQKDDDDPFNDDTDSPKGYRIYYSLSLSLEPSLFTTTSLSKGKKVVSKMPVPVANPQAFSKGAMNDLMEACQSALKGKQLDPKKKLSSEL